MKEAANWGGLP